MSHPSYHDESLFDKPKDVTGPCPPTQRDVAYGNVCTGTSPYRTYYRGLLEEKAVSLLRQATQIKALLRALPEDMNPEAAEALCKLITGY